MNIDFTTFVPRDQIIPLTWLGRREWVDSGYVKETNHIYAKLDPKIANELPQNTEQRTGITSVLNLVRNIGDPVSYLMYNTLSKCLAQGPKLFVPTTLECEAMENTEVSIPFDVYHQPYPVVLIQVPKEYREGLVERFGIEHGPQYVFVHYLEDKNPRSIVTTTFFNRANAICHLAMDRPEYETIDDTITKNRRNRRDWGTDNTEKFTGDFEVAEVVQRLGMNFSFIMASHGVNSLGPVDKDAWKKHKKMASGKDERDRERGRKFLASTIEVIELKQKITFYEEDFFGETPPGKKSDSEGEGETRHVRPHWRRGHYRRQWKGTGEARHQEWIWIKAILVRARFFGGDLSQTSVTYEGVARNPARNACDKTTIVP